MTAAAKRNGRSLTTIVPPQQEAGKGEKGEGEGQPPHVLGIRDLFSKELWVISSVMFVAWPVGNTHPPRLIVTNRRMSTEHNYKKFAVIEILLNKGYYPLTLRG